MTTKSEFLASIIYEELYKTLTPFIAEKENFDYEAIIYALGVTTTMVIMSCIMPDDRGKALHMYCEALRKYLNQSSSDHAPHVTH